VGGFFLLSPLPSGEKVRACPAPDAGEPGFERGISQLIFYSLPYKGRVREG